jgi:hypothetical protein
MLTSWKDIADYLGKSIRTVQRWERELGLPVRRPAAKQNGVVIALPEELDAWIHAMPTAALAPAPQADAQPNVVPMRRAVGGGAPTVRAARKS